MKASNDLIKKFGVDKFIHGLIGMLILAVCVVASVFLFGVSFPSVLGGMVLGTVSAWLVNGRNRKTMFRIWQTSGRRYAGHCWRMWSYYWYG